MAAGGAGQKQEEDTVVPGQGSVRLAKVTARKKGGRRGGSAVPGVPEGGLPDAFPAAVPAAAPPGPHSPCCGWGSGLSRRLGAAGLGADQRLLQSPPQRPLIRGRGLLPPRPPSFGYICMQGGSTHLEGSGSLPRRLLGCRGTPKCRGLRLLSLCQEGSGGRPAKLRADLGFSPQWGHAVLSHQTTVWSAYSSPHSALPPAFLHCRFSGIWWQTPQDHLGL